MGLLSNLLLPGRLRTGPTVLLPAKTKPEAILELVRLADPKAELDGGDVLAAATRIHEGIELTGDLAKKLGLDGEEKLWAHRVVAERPLPIDYYDKLLAAGLAYRLDGYCLCEGSADDPAEDPELVYAVYLPAVEESELTPALVKILGTDDGLAEDAPEASPDASATEVPESAETGAEAAVSAPEDTTEAPTTTEADSAASTAGKTDVATEAETPGAAPDDANAKADADAVAEVEDEAASDAEAEAATARRSRWSADGVYEAAGFRVSVTPVHRFPAAVAGLMPYATEVVKISVSATEELEGDARMLEPGKVALALGTALDGPVVDHWGFQVFEPADLLPPRSV
ncbi:hypothetical protein [Herbidospora cretacea]|uniref:hypothetical protein n=1 Tax=Herbidospora cretacea TaxID=28444 RepID=UPI000773FBD7|nr:hypothetical protein [Herbidospora cretacea]